MPPEKRPATPLAPRPGNEPRVLLTRDLFRGAPVVHIVHGNPV